MVGCAAKGPVDAPRAVSADERGVRAVVTTYFRAADADDARTMCASFTDELARYVARLQQSPCHEALSAELRNLPESLRGYEIQGVRIDGNTAIVAVDGPGGKERMTLQRAGAGWKIETAPGLGV